MYKNKIIDKALKDIEIKKQEAEERERERTHKFMKSFFGPDYKESFSEISHEEYNRLFFMPVGYEDIVFSVDIVVDIMFNESSYSIFRVIDNSRSPFKSIPRYSDCCFTDIYRFAENIKEASDIAKRENENEY
jgi:hypothetical protein